mmetsp:Transcript_6450/g.5539  ORF Transcript_6450/g.5539 Transcript_6450/m.5539 type:complete len:120 (-) Transcript_6450:1057-1416(-)
MISLRFTKINLCEDAESREYLKTFFLCPYIQKLEISHLKAPINSETVQYLSSIFSSPDCQIYSTLKQITLKNVSLTDGVSFTDTILTNFTNLQKITFESVTTNEDFCTLLYQKIKKTAK